MNGTVVLPAQIDFPDSELIYCKSCGLKIAKVGCHKYIAQKPTLKSSDLSVALVLIDDKELRTELEPSYL